MITVRPGSHMYFMLRLLSVSGEFPSRSVGIIGDTRTVKAMIHKMEAVQQIRLQSDNTVLYAKLFQASGKWNDRTIRLNKNALAVLNDIHPDAPGYYLESFPDNKFSGDQFHVWRNHRVGETVAVCMMAGIETAPYILPKLQKESIRSVIPETPCYYVARNIKKISEAELNKTMFARMVGLLFYPGGSYAVYNTRDTVMKWSGLGEFKAKLELDEIVRMNAGLAGVTSALLFGTEEHTAMQILTESENNRQKYIKKKGEQFNDIYPSIHFVPLDQNGISMVKILTLPDWREKLMNALFSPQMRRQGYGSVEFDAYRGSKYYYSHLDGDISRLIRFKEAFGEQEYDFEVLCFPWQVRFLHGYLGESAVLKQLEIPAVLKALGIAY
jgi:hypothetical protein